MMNKKYSEKVATSLKMLCIAGTGVSYAKKVQEARVKRYITSGKHPENVYLGDAHIHTRLSVDASLWGNILVPEQVVNIN
jgi:hypothetical protein